MQTGKQILLASPCRLLLNYYTKKYSIYTNTNQLSMILTTATKTIIIFENSEVVFSLESIGNLEFRKHLEINSKFYTNQIERSIWSYIYLRC